MEKEVLRTKKGTVIGAYALAEVKHKLKREGIDFEQRESGDYNRIFVEVEDQDDSFKDVKIE